MFRWDSFVFFTLAVPAMKLPIKKSITNPENELQILWHPGYDKIFLFTAHFLPGLIR